MMPMKYSSDGLKLTSLFEGCRLLAYKCPAGIWTIGYGHTHGVHEGQTCTQEQADAWLVEDIESTERMVNHLVKVPMTQGQYDALVDFAFNLGASALSGSTLLALLNAGNYEGAAEQFERWHHVGGKDCAGLFRRRAAERAEFEGG